nr:xenopsin 2 [Peronia verruculata]
MALASPRIMETTLSSLTESPISPEEHSLGPTGNETGSRFTPLSDGGFMFIAIMLSTTFSLGSFFNGLCLYVFAKNKRLRSPTNIFVMSLNLCDFLMCFVGTPFALSSAWAREWIWGDAICDVEGFIVYFLGMASMYILMAIAFDRYIAISKPLLGTKITKTVALVSCSGCYFLGFLWAILPAFGWNEYQLEGAGISCSVVWESSDPVYMSYIFTIFVFCLIIPLGVMFYSYWGVLGTLRGLNKNSVWDMNSRVAKKNLAIERKMLKTAVLIVASFLGCWMPYAVVSFVAAFFGHTLIPPLLATVPPVIAKCQGLIDPIVYVATNKQMRTAIYEILPCESLRSSLLKGEEEPVEEADSEESDVEGGAKSSKPEKSKKSKGGESGKKEEKKKKSSGGKKNQVHALTVEPSADEGVSEVSNLDAPTATPVSSIQINQSGQDGQVTYTNNEGGASP